MKRSDSEPMSAFGNWFVDAGLPVFVVPASSLVERLDEERRFHVVGNRVIQLLACTEGTVGIYDESGGMRWQFFSDGANGTGTSTLTESDGTTWGTARGDWPEGGETALFFRPTSFDVVATHEGLTVWRRVLCPEGDLPWVFVEVSLRLAADRPGRTIEHSETWQLRPRFLETFGKASVADERAAQVRYITSIEDQRVVATEDFAAVDAPVGAPFTLTLEALTGIPTEVGVGFAEGAVHPSMRATTTVVLEPGREQRLWFRVGRLATTDSGLADPAEFRDANRRQLLDRLPSPAVERFPELSSELMWHGAALTGGVSRDDVLGGHTISQGSTYAYLWGANAAARDQCQHALPLIYTEPDLALSVLRNTCAWGSPDGDLPYALTATKAPLDNLFRPSDQQLWLLWLAAEYGIATGDLGAFAEPVGFHPVHGAEPVSLTEHLVRAFRFFVDEIGVGRLGHIRILNADWNDMVLHDTGVDPELMQREGESVLNSAMAAWVLPVFAALLDSLGETTTADEARRIAEQLRGRVAAAWNGRWFDRGYAPDGTPVGRDRCWLEVQPWAILCGATDDDRARALLRTIDEMHRANSPLGARVIWPLRDTTDAGMGTRGGIWYSINMTLIWAAASLDPDLAWDEWHRMTLRNHVSAYPDRWEGTLSGPDSWNSPEATRPGQTWAYPWMSMQDFPVANMHSHAQPLLSYLRLLGVQPLADGTLAGDVNVLRRRSAMTGPMTE